MCELENLNLKSWIHIREPTILFRCPLLLAIIYLAFNVIYVVPAGGTDPSGNDYIYSVLKWNENPGMYFDKYRLHSFF